MGNAMATLELLGVAALVLLFVGIAVVPDRFPAAIVRPWSGPSIPIWSTFRGDAARTGATDEVGPNGDPGVRWQLTVPKAVRPSLVIAGDRGYAAGIEGGIDEIDLKSGAVLRRFAVGTVTGVPTLVDGVLYAGTSDGNLFALAVDSGTERWRIHGNGAYCCSPAVADGLVVAGTANGALTTVDAETGEERWRVDLPLTVWSSPSVAEGTVVVGNDQNQLFAFDETTGSERWRFRTAGNGVVPAAAIADGTVYVGTLDGALYAIDLATGTERWHFSGTGTVFTPSIGDGVVYAGGVDGSLYGLDAATGQTRWTFAAGSRLQAQPALAGGVLYVLTADGALIAVDAETGREQWRLAVGIANYGPVVSNGAAYAWVAGGLVAVIDGGTVVISQGAPCQCNGSTRDLFR